MPVHETAMVENATLGDDSRLYERVSIKKSTVGEAVDGNAGTYVENARIADRVQVGPNASVVGVTHDLSENGMEHRNDSSRRSSSRPGRSSAPARSRRRRRGRPAEQPRG